MKKIILPLLLALHTFSAFATEVDNITTYYDLLTDSEPVLNQNVQEKIDLALSRTAGCRRPNFARAAASQLVGNIIYGTVEAYANGADEVDKSITAVQASIYHRTSYQGGVVDTFVNLGPTINVGGYHVGTDKIGHFFAMGYDLYNSAKWGQSVQQLIGHSRREEKGLWGLYITGVKSYGDIAANFDGYRFWKDLVDEGPNQFLVCEEGKLKQVRPFRWSDYISAAWNEAINCNRYWNEDFGRQVALNVTKLESKFHRRFTCPIDPQQCKTLRAHYAQWAPGPLVNELISPDCR